MTYINTFLIDNRKLIRMTVATAIALFILLFPITLMASVDLGGYISEKVLGDGTNEALHLGDGANELTVLGSGPVISTSSVTNNISEGGVISATLHGNLINLNGMPRADVWFVWGYAAGSMSNTTATSTVTDTGDQSVVIHPNAGEEVYYQFRSSTDGTSFGSTQHFISGGGHGLSYWMLNIILPILIACAILVFVLIATGNPLYAFGGAVIGLAAFYIVKAIVEMLY